MPTFTLKALLSRPSPTVTAKALPAHSGALGSAARETSRNRLNAGNGKPGGNGQPG